MDLKFGYYYLTISDQLKFKSEEEVKDPLLMFDDPFVKKFWHVQKESDYIAMIIEVEQSVYYEIINRSTMRYHSHHG